MWSIIRLRNSLAASAGLLFCGALAACGAGLPVEERETQSAARILLIGNSMLFQNGGVDRQLQALAPYADVEMVAYPGYSLEDHWAQGEALSMLRTGGYRFVVLQEQTQRPVTRYEVFLQYAAGFDEWVRAQGGETILLMTWERPDSVRYGVTTGGLASAFSSAGAALGVRVAPAGVAFATALTGRPDLRLNIEDGHPTMAGTYLVACVLYAVILGRSPADNSYIERSLYPEDGAFLQRIAAKAAGF